MNITLQIHKDKYSTELRVAVYKNGVYNEDATYYTDCMEDAKGTMADMGRRYSQIACAVVTFKNIIKKCEFTA